MRVLATFLALGACLAPSAMAASEAPAADAPTSSGQCRPGYSLYDTGSPGSFKEDRNLNGLVCDKVTDLGGGLFSHRYTDDRVR